MADPTTSISLAGRTALVLGANGLIGRALAEAFGGAGARLVLGSRDGSRLAELADGLVVRGYDVVAAPVDVTDADAVERFVAGHAGAGLDVAVNNVGTPHRPAPLADLDLAELDRVLATTLRGVAVAMKHELGVLRDGGAIVNIASSAGLDGAPGMSGYVAAKHGVVGLTSTAAIDYASRGIRVNAVAPGPIASGPIMRQDEQIRRHVGGLVPLGRMGSPEEVARAALWLASPLASYTTGSVLTVDGGKRA
jgi:NAD(P)-dependent dehydrogenase (short-subunit alcohol dehydrogenase family)